MGRAIFSLSLVFLLIAYTQQFGVLYVNDIIGNSDRANVYVEESIFNDNSLLTTFINGLVDCTPDQPRCGVYVELVNYFDGNVDVPVNLEVFINTTINGTFYPNGGLRSDSFPSDGYSFLVEDNTGNTGMAGELRLYGGLVADGGVFTVADGTGETTISVALLKPNGGIDVQNGQFTAAKEDGTFFTSNFANVEGDFYLGTSVSEDRYITRIADPSSYGGDTYILGQSATSVGGNLIFEPGVGQDREIGKIIIGRQANDNLFFGRPPVDESGTSGGTTFFRGQGTDYGRGGDIVFSSGDSTAAGNGGDIVLDVGNSEASHGNIIIGSQSALQHNLFVRRPSITDGPGGATFISGQSTSQGDAGDLYLRAGGLINAQGTLLTGTPGVLSLLPGALLDTNLAPSQGRIVLGRSTPVDLIVRRYPNLGASNAGDTVFDALNGATGLEGGDLYLQAGSGGNSGNGGDVYLKLGDLTSTTITDPGRIFWGVESTTTNQQLTVRRATSVGAGSSTNIVGQESISFNGGTLTFQAGTGSTNSGTLTLSAGTGSLSDGGSVTITGGDGASAGGSVSFTAGTGSTTAGNVNFNAGAATGFASGGISPVGGSIYLNAGSGSSLGDVEILNARQLTIQTTSATLYDILQIQHGDNGDKLIISANPESIVSFNGDTLIKDRISNVQAVDNTPLVAPVINIPPYYTYPIIRRIQNIADTTLNVINALAQCGHGLFTVVDNAGNAAYCNMPGPVPTPIVRPTD